MCDLLMCSRSWKKNYIISVINVTLILIFYLYAAPYLNLISNYESQIIQLFKIVRGVS